MGNQQKPVIKSANLRRKLTGSARKFRHEFIGVKVTRDEKASIAEAAFSVSLKSSQYLRELHRLAVEGELGGANNES